MSRCLSHTAVSQQTASASQPSRPVAAARSAAFFRGSSQSARLSASSRVPAASRSALRVEAARTKENKAELVADLTQRYNDSMLVASLDFMGLSVKQMEVVRRSLPEGTKLVVTKNTLAKIANNNCETPCEELNDVLKGPSAFLFINENIKDSLNAIKSAKKDMVEDEESTILSFTGASMEGDFFAGKDVMKLESMPTKQELIAKIAGMIKSIPQKTAVSINQVPSKLAYGVKAVPNKVGYGFRAWKESLDEEA